MKRKNKSTLLVCINCMIITLAILLLPLAFFETSIYVKRSANTFVGDEKYVEARAEVETVAAQHEGAVIEESVTERVNSKGVTTSMVTFTVKETVRRNGLDFLLHGVGHSEGMSGVGPANVMRLLLGSMMLGACTGCGLCAAKCPKKAITMRDRRAPRNKLDKVKKAPTAAKPAAPVAPKAPAESK